MSRIVERAREKPLSELMGAYHICVIRFHWVNNEVCCATCVLQSIFFNENDSIPIRISLSRP